MASENATSGITSGSPRASPELSIPTRIDSMTVSEPAVSRRPLDDSASETIGELKDESEMKDTSEIKEVKENESETVGETVKPDVFETPDELSDITLIVEDKRLYVHKLMLGYSSPVFRKMFSGNFKEGTASEIPLPGKPYQAFVNFLHQIYPGPPSITPIQDDTVADMLALADEYQVGFLVDKCKDYVKKQVSTGLGSLNVELTMMYLYLCHKYTHHLSFWDDFLKRATALDYRQVKNNTFFQQLPSERRTELLELRLELLESARASSISSFISETVQLKPADYHLSNKRNQNCAGHIGTICEKCPATKLADKLQSAANEMIRLVPSNDQGSTSRKTWH